MITSRIGTKAQTTIPRAVRLALGVRDGDEIAYAIENGRVVLTKAPARLADGGSHSDPFKTFAEWDSEADRRAYADL